MNGLTYIFIPSPANPTRELWSSRYVIRLDTITIVTMHTSVRNCCLSCSPKPIDLMEDQQLYNLDGPLDQQHFIVTKLQYKYSLHFRIIFHVFYKFILWRTTHFFSGPTVFLKLLVPRPGSNFAKGRTLMHTYVQRDRTRESICMFLVSIFVFSYT